MFELKADSYAKKRQLPLPGRFANDANLQCSLLISTVDLSILHSSTVKNNTNGFFSHLVWIYPTIFQRWDGPGQGELRTVWEIDQVCAVYGTFNLILHGHGVFV